MPFYGTVLGKQKITLCFASYPSRVGNWGAPQFALPIARRSWQTVCQNIPWPFWGIFSLNVYALGGFLKLSEHSPAFLAVSVLFLPMQSVGCARGNRRWIRWRERRRAIPYLLPFPSDPAPAHWVQKPAPRFLTTRERAWRSACLPPKR